MDLMQRKSTELSVLSQSLWSQKFYDVLLAELPFNAIISKDYEGEISGFLGDSVRISTFPEFDAANLLGEDERNDASAITVTQQTLNINYRVAKDFIITNLAMLQSLPSMDKLRDLAIYSINKKIQSLIISLIVPSASAPDHTIAFTSGTTLALADILAAKELLDAQDVPFSNRHMVMGAAQLNDLFAISNFTSSDFVASNAPIISGQLPAQICGFQPQFTSELGNVVYCLHSSFMTMAAQQGMNVKEYDRGVEGSRDYRINCDTVLGIKQLDNLRVVQIG